VPKKQNSKTKNAENDKDMKIIGNSGRVKGRKTG
jgi:hypothetical protein